MKAEFTHREKGNRRLILIFAGWSTDASFYSHVWLKGWDTLVAWDYSDFNFPAELLSSYHTIHLFAWSLGVFAASRSLPFDKLTLAVAVNGTEYPVDDAFGIPVDIYTGTAEGLDQRNLLKFWKRVAGTAYSEIADKFPLSDIDRLKVELSVIRQEQSNHAPSEANASGKRASRWDEVIISRADSIFPVRAQRLFWLGHHARPKIRVIDGPHFIDILTLAKAFIPSSEKVGERFFRALPTYDAHASAQGEIAQHLLDFILARRHGGKLRRVAEIGPGSGMFSRLFAKSFDIFHIDYIDLYPLPLFNLSETENSIVGDAEEWSAAKASEAPASYDAVVSASSIQWLINPERFFRSVAKLLKPDGFLTFSTFLPDNLEELLPLRPLGMHYPSKDKITGMLERLFGKVETREERISLSFGSPRELLAHLQKTGVGGSSASNIPVKELLSKLPDSLTFHPLYVYAEHPLRST